MAGKKKAIIFSSIFLLFLLVGRLYTGIYKDDEFDDSYFFIKNAPAWKWHFYSPRGMSDLKLIDMTVAQQNEQIMYDRYIPNKLFYIPM
ncbi:hypothetical protein [Pedobacter duraquae]|uniref:Uncharacterized protein n=1 Tax=Pedobacter duraquae TaxID=425511 RepID=A0A4R6IGU5_9SPHI|nr:hypothetical protein [Pedobacter duraquae]TDO20937.1 hypothetical protein CLV32_3574 [Pedobacter duraquae]